MSRCGLPLRTSAELGSHQKNCAECVERRRQIRQETMRKVWETHSEELRASASRTAKRTSARQDVQDARAERLRAWREREPEKFRTECTEKMLAARRESLQVVSCLEETVSGLLPGFKRNAQVRAGPMVRQVDFLGEFMVEVDGLHHFRPLHGRERFETTTLRDLVLTEWVRSSRKTLVRVSLDCFTSSGAIRPLWREVVEATLRHPPAGVSLLGDLYGSINLPWDRWWISRSGEIISLYSETD